MKVYTIINEILQSCTYILSSDDDAGVYLVDCGDTSPIMDYLKGHRRFIKGVLLTHAHYDHIYGLNDIIKEYPDVTLYASEKTFQGLEDSDLNMSYLYTDDDFVVSFRKESAIVVLNHACYKIFDQEVECLYTPGHDVDCVSYRIGEMLFTGDSYNPNSPVFTKWRNSNVDEAIENETRLRRLATENGLTVYPGHNIDL